MMRLGPRLARSSALALVLGGLLAGSARAAGPKSSATTLIVDDLTGGSAGTVQAAAGIMLLDGTLSQVAVASASAGSALVESGFLSAIATTPASASITLVSSTTLKAVWNQPPLLNPAGTLYTVEASTAPDFSGTIFSSASLSNTAAVFGLRSFTTYSVRMKASYMGLDETGYMAVGSSTTLPNLPSGCGVGYNVKQDGTQDFTSIQAAVDALPIVLSTSACVVVRDTGTYNESLTVSNIYTNNGFAIKIIADPSFVSSGPTLSPPAASVVSAVSLLASSVTLSNIRIFIANPLVYGVEGNADYLTLSSVSVTDLGLNLSAFGFQLRNWSSISNASMTALQSGGLYLIGDHNTVTQTSVTIYSNSDALTVVGSSNVLSSSYFASGAEAARITGGYNTITRSTITAFGSFGGSPAYYVGGVGAIGNVFSQGVIRSSGSTNIAYGALFDAPASSNTILQSTVAAYGPSSIGVYWNGVAGHTVWQSSVTGAFYGVWDSTGAANTVARSTISSGGVGVYLSATTADTVSQSVITSSATSQPALKMVGDAGTLVTQSVVAGQGYYGLLMIWSSSDTIQQSVLATNSGPSVVSVQGASSNTFNQDFLTNGTSVTGLALDGSANGNTITQSTVNVSGIGAGSAAIRVTNTSSSNTVDHCSILSPGGSGVEFIGGSYNTVRASTITSQDTLNTFWGVHFLSSSYNTVSQSVINHLTGSSGYGVSFDQGANVSTLLESSVTASGVALTVSGASSTTVAGSGVFGATSITVNGSTGTTIRASTLYTNSTNGIALNFTGGSSNLWVTGSGFYSSGVQGVDALLDPYGGGSLVLSSNVFSGGGTCVVCVATQTAGSTVWITSNTFLPPFPTAGGLPPSYGLLLRGLQTGATVEFNSIYYRSTGGTPSRIFYGMSLESSSGLLIDHNRVNQNAMLTLSGSFIPVSFAGVQNSSFKFNDVFSSGTYNYSAAPASLVQLFSSSVSVRDNIFAGYIWNPSASSATVYASADSGYLADYNDYFSTGAMNFVWGPQSYAFPWGVATGVDVHAAGGNPLWPGLVAGAEDFHPLSTAGRCINPPLCSNHVTDAVDSPTIDLADPAESYTAEPAPNGSRANQGSTGQSAEASQTQTAAGACPVVRKVCRTGACSYPSIQSAVNSLPNPLTGYSCVSIQDSATYAEQVTVQNFTMNGSSIAIYAASGFAPIVNPPAGSSAAFMIVNASVSVSGFNIVPSNPLTYGVYVSSTYVSLNGVNIADASGKINGSGVVASSWTTIAYTTVTVGNANAFLLPGSTMTTISYSSATANGSFPKVALNINGASNNTFTSLAVTNGAGQGVSVLYSNYNSFSGLTVLSGGSSNMAFYLAYSNYNALTNVASNSPGGYGFYSNNASFNTISSATFSSATPGPAALLLSYVSSCTFTQVAAVNSSGYALWLQGPSNGNVFQQSTFTTNTVSYYALYASGSSSNTFYGDSISNVTGRAAQFDTAAGYNTISHSTITGGGGAMGALYFFNAVSNYVNASYVAGSTAVYISASSGTYIGASQLVATGVGGSALWMDQGSTDLTLTASRVSASSSGAAIDIDAGNQGVINISTNQITGAQYGVAVATQSSAAQIWITSNTILPPTSVNNKIYGVYLNGLTSGATVENNAVYFRTSGSMGAFTGYGLYAQSASGLLIAHNRINNPGVITGGSFVGVGLSGVKGAAFKFNDVNAAESGLTSAYLLQAVNGSSNLVIKDNAFASNFGGGSTATLTVDAASLGGFASNYNDYFSTQTRLTFQWGSGQAQGIAAWQSLSGQDLNAVGWNPRWATNVAGIEDFHMLSDAGRWNGTAFAPDFFTSGAIDAADPTEPYVNEAGANGSHANIGSYGNTAEASQTPAIPTSPVVAAVSSTTIRVSWGVVTSHGYTVQASSASGVSISSSIAIGVASTLAPQGLLPNTTYSLLTQSLWGDFTATAPALTTATLAAPVTTAVTTFTAVQANLIAVSWSANSNPLSITTYTVALSTDAVFPNTFTGTVFVSTVPGGALPTATVIGLIANTTYFAFAAATNWNNVSTSYTALGSTSTLALAPAVSSVSFAAVGSTNLSVLWSANGDPAPWTTYVVQASTASDFSGTLIAVTTTPAGSPSAPLIGLTANTTYFARAAAVNNNGISSSFTNLGSTITNAAIPTFLSPAFSAVGSTTATLSWLADGNPLGVTTYTVTLSPSSSFSTANPGNVTISTLATLTPPRGTLTGLSPNTTYFGFVAALNADGSNTNYSVLGATATLANAPGVAAITFTGLAMSSFSVNWSANSNPLSLTTYTVQASTASDFNVAATSFTMSTAPAGAPAATFNGLSANTTYFVRVQAINYGGTLTAFTSLGSTVTSPVTLQAPTPGSLIVTASSISATWSLQPLATGYTLVASTSSANPPTAPVFSGNFVGAAALGGSATGLNPNTTYFLFIQATGPGAATAFVSYPATATLAAAPTASPTPFAAVNVTSMTVNWLGGGNPVGVTTYTVVLSTGSSYPNTFAGNVSASTVPAGALSASFTGLSDNTLYYLYVSALNYGGNATSFSALGSTVNPISAPTAMVLDEISSTTIVASAYAPTPLFANLGVGQSGTQQAIGLAYQPVHGEQWTSKAVMTTSRAEMAAAVLDGRIYVVGGYNGGYTTAAEAYDPAANTWSTLAAAPTSRADTAGAAAGGKIYIVGGTNNFGSSGLTLNEQYDPATNSWSTKAAMPSARFFLNALSLGGNVYAAGGIGAAGTELERYDPAADSWATLVPLSTPASRAAAAVTAGSLAGSFYIAGGAGPSAAASRYDTGADAWSAKRSMPTALQEGAGVSLGGKIYFIGGNDGGASANAITYEYDPAVDFWAARSSMTTGRWNLAAAESGGRIYAIGGTSAGPVYTALNEQYDPGTATRFTGLSPNTLYSFKARARNQVGALSAEVASVSTYTLAALPLATTPTTVFVAADSATFQWAAGGNPALTQYQASVSTSAAFAASVPSPASGWGTAVSTAVTSLSPNSTYYLRVKARNFANVETIYVFLGSTMTSAASASVSTPTFSSVSNAAVTLSWLSGGNPIVVTTYTVVLTTGTSYPNSNGGNVSLSTMPGGSLPTASFAGLQADTSYYAFVSAQGISGVPSAFVNVGATTTLANAPVATPPSFTAVYPSSAVVAWSNNGNPAPNTVYDVVLSTDAAYPNADTGNLHISSYPAGAFASATFTGLAVNTTYFAFIAAGNTAGSYTSYTALGATSTLTNSPLAAAPAFVNVGYSSFTVLWNANGNPLAVTSYTVSASTASDFNAGSNPISLTTAPVSGPAATFSGLISNTSYYVRALAINHGGIATTFTTLGSTLTAVYTISAPPPSGFVAVMASSITATWGVVPGATGYFLVASTSPSTPPAIYASSVSLGVAATTATVFSPALSANTTYFLFVRADGPNATSAYAAFLGTSTLANPPSAVAATFSALTTAGFTVAWGANGNPANVTAYVAEVSTASDFNAFASSVTISTYPAGAPSALFAGLSPNTSYYFRVQAVNSNGVGTTFTPAASTATLPTTPAASAATFSGVGVSALTVSWLSGGNPADVTAYDVVLSTGAAFPNADAGNISLATTPAGALPTASLNGLVANTAYFAYVAAVGYAGNVSAYAALGSTSTLVFAPAALSPAFSGVQNTTFTVSWSANANPADVTLYQLIASTGSSFPNTDFLNLSLSTTPAGTPPTGTFTGLAVNTTYFVYAAAVNAGGSPTAFINLGSTSTLPDAPTPAAASFGIVGYSSVTVFWSAARNPLSITTYTVQLSTASDFNAFASSVTISTLPAGAPGAFFSGLLGSSTYYVRVAALSHNGVETAFLSLGSTVTYPSPLFPVVINTQTGDAAWRRSNSGVYSTSFSDASGSHLVKFQVKASTTPGGAGTDLVAFTDVITGLSPADTFSTPWSLPPAVFNGLMDGVTNYISIKVFNGPPLNNFTFVQDAFYVLKDTTAPTIVNAQTGDAMVRSVAGSTYAVSAFDLGSRLASFQYSASLVAGSGNAAIVPWTDISSVAYSTSYTTGWPVDFTALVTGVTNYISVRAVDIAGATTTLTDAFYVLKDTVGPTVAFSTPTSGSYPSALAALGGTAAGPFGVQGVEVAVQLNPPGGLYWNPGAGAFNSASPSWMTAVGTTTWSLNPGITWVDGTTYMAVARASTPFNNYSAVYASSTFAFDASTPTVAVVSPAAAATISSLPLITGTALDPGASPSGVATVEVRLRRNADGKWWNWFTQTWNFVAISTIASGTTAWSVSPTTLLLANLDNGASYYVAVRANDNATPVNQGDFFVSGATFTWADVTPPGAVANLTAVSGSQPGRINLAWTATGDDVNSGLLLSAQYRIYYSTDVAAVASTATAQVAYSTGGISPGDAQSYTLTGLNPSATYYISLALADSDGNWSAFSNQASTVATPAPFNAITGHVVDLSTQGITAVEVDCWDANGALAATAFTQADGSGTYIVSGLVAGNYKLKVTWTVNGVSSSLWQDGIAMGSSGVDFVLEINYALATLTGTLSTLNTASAAGAGTLSVGAYRGAAGAAASHVELYQGGRQVALVSPKPTGRWTIPSLLPGKYSVRAFTGIGYTPFVEVTLQEGEVKTLGFVFDPLPDSGVFNFPNPARTSTTLRFQTALAPLEAQIVIFDLAGNIVREIPGDQIQLAQGQTDVYHYKWDLTNSSGRDVASGVYFMMVKIKGGSENQSAKVIKKVAVVR
jgi:hypothetical protein